MLDDVKVMQWLLLNFLKDYEEKAIDFLCYTLHKTFNPKNSDFPQFDLN